MNDIQKALQFLCDEKGLQYEIVFEALEGALAAAYRKDFGNRQGNYTVKFDVETGDIKVWDVKEVVQDIGEEALEKSQEELIVRREKANAEERELTQEEIVDLPSFNPKTEMMLTEAKEVDSKATIGQVLEISQEVPGEFGRMAAQTAKQVIIQKLREAERKNVFEDFKNQEGRVVQGIIQRRDRSGGLIIDLGKITGRVPATDIVRGEMYRPGSRMQFYVVSVKMEARGPEIVLSRSTNKMVQSVFEQEIPEVEDGSVQIKDISRDPGNRSKVAVMTEDESIDPIGACIGQRGSRITTIINELGGEKIDVIEWNEDHVQYIKNALSPAKVLSVELNETEEEKIAIVKVDADQFSLAIGRGGVNVRLAAQLTGWKIDVVQEGVEEEPSNDDEDADTAVLEQEKEETPEETTEEIVTEVESTEGESEKE